MHNHWLLKMGNWPKLESRMVRSGAIAKIDVIERLSPILPEIPAQISFACVCSFLAIAFRLAIDTAAHGAGPFSTTIPFVLVATLFGRWLSGILCLTITNLFVWYYVLPPVGSFLFKSPEDSTRVFMNFVSGFVVVALAEIFRRSVKQAMKERDFLLLELEHRVANNFASVASMLRLQIKNAEHPAVIASLQATLGRIQSYATANGLLYRGSAYTGSINMAAFLKELCHELQTSLAKDTHFQIHCNSEPISMPRDRAITMGLLVNEVATNSFKHAFSDRSHGSVNILLTEHTDGMRLVVSDDGTGITSGQRSGSLGQTLINMLAQQAQATVETKSDSGGTVFTFQFAA